MAEVVNAGRLIVFEGPDGVGKSTLAQALTNRLVAMGLSCEHLTFPGREEGTIGSLVYDVHHCPAEYGIGAITAASLQALHIAAHLDAIERRIIPALNEGRWVILDRFWWSTWAYGYVAAVDRATLDAMVQVERLHWCGVEPDALFLLDRHNGSFDGDGRVQLRESYHLLYENEKSRYPIHRIQNDLSVDRSVDRLLAAIRDFVPSAANFNSRGPQKLGPPRERAVVSPFDGRRASNDLHQASVRSPDCRLQQLLAIRRRAARGVLPQDRRIRRSVDERPYHRPP